jgi:ABC-type Fe3+/spermidine/putrescine transport system ATPase subunit
MGERVTEQHLQVDSVTKVFESGVLAVDRASFSVRKSEFLTILGPSGSGKTTLLRMIAGFEPPTSGEIYLNGRPLTPVPPNKRPVNTVFQNYALFPHMNVLNNVGYGLVAKRMHKDEIQARVKRALELVSLSGLERRHPEQLSGGQQQRVALARALVCEPEILLSDESLGALDLKLRKQTQIALKSIQKTTNITFIHVTHDQEEAFTMSDRIVVMNNGVIEQIGSPLDLYFNPKTMFVGGFIGENNLIRVRVVSYDGKDLVVESSRRDRIVVSGSKVRGGRVKAGDEVFIFVRPESISLGEISAGANRFSAKVLDVMVIGSEVKILLRFGDADTIIVKIPTPTDVRSLSLGVSRGEEVRFGFEPEDVIGVYAKDGEPG